jgi:hypothetical protein
MNVLFYRAGPNGGAEELLRSLSALFPGGGLNTVSDLASFSERIRKPRGPDSIAIIWNPSHADLRELGALKDRLRTGRTLLALADEEKETITLAHALLPAFITYVDGDHSEVISVIKKLARAKASDRGQGLSS